MEQGTKYTGTPGPVSPPAAAAVPGRVEQGMKDTAKGIAAAATGAVDAVTDTAGMAADAVKDTVGEAVDAVKDTMGAVGGAAHDAVSSVKDAFDMRRHPWLLLGGAVLAGFLLGNLTRRAGR